MRIKLNLEDHFRSYILKVYNEHVDHGLKYEKIRVQLEPTHGNIYEIYEVEWYNAGDFLRKTIIPVLNEQNIDL